MLVSIIVPVFNVESYLEKCINSLINQNLGKQNYEIIAVNDGSTDNSLSVLKRIKQNNKDIILNILSQKNQGLSGARNSGIDIAKGKFIVFVDSDDVLLPNILKDIISLAQDNELDILEFGASGITESGKITFTAKSTSHNEILTGENYLATISYLGSACNKVYNLNFLNKNRLRFMPHVYIEDIEFNTRAVFLSNKIMATDIVAAHFLKRDGSITRTSNFLKRKKMIYDIHKVITSINDFNESKITDSSVAYIPIKKRTCALITTMLLRILTGINDYSIKKEIFCKLIEQNLYPIPYKTDSKTKNWFRLLANNDILFSTLCKINCVRNKLHEK